jgi:NitT/TauT family transport system permease protein
MRIVRRVVPPLGVLVLVVAAWFVASNALLKPDRRFLLPSPDAVVRVSYLDPYHLADLLRALALSAQVALAGLAIAFVVGVASAVLMSQARWLERSLYPYAVLLQTVPILALIPLFGYWFGFGYVSRVLVVVLFALFPVIANTLFGLRSVDRGHHDLFTLYGAGRLTRLWKLQLPTAVPSIFTGLRVSAGAAVIGAVVGDFFFKQGQPGIGQLIQNYSQGATPELLFGSVLLSSLFGLVVFLVFAGVARRVAFWHESNES